MRRTARSLNAKAILDLLVGGGPPAVHHDQASYRAARILGERLARAGPGKRSCWCAHRERRTCWRAATSSPPTDPHPVAGPGRHWSTPLPVCSSMHSTTPSDASPQGSLHRPGDPQDQRGEPPGGHQGRSLLEASTARNRRDHHPAARKRRPRDRLTERPSPKLHCNLVS